MNSSPSLPGHLKAELLPCSSATIDSALTQKFQMLAFDGQEAKPLARLAKLKYIHFQRDSIVLKLDASAAERLMIR